MRVREKIADLEEYEYDFWHIIKSIHIVAQQEHDCSASLWVDNGLLDNIDNIDDLKLSVMKTILRARNESWKIKSGTVYQKTFGYQEGEFFISRNRLDMLNIALKYDLYHR